MDTKKKVGGAREGAGRKPAVAGAPATATVSVKVSEEQKEKLRLLGGAQWVRDKIDEVKLTAASRKVLAELDRVSKAKLPKE